MQDKEQEAAIQLGGDHVAKPEHVAEEQPYDHKYGWYAVFVLILAYTVSYVDRQILTLLVEPIKESLQISDVQISLLHGLAFAIFYTALGIPIARLADRYNRVKIITAGVFIWSAMTALCGASKNFTQLFAARVGVGVGEAALSPAAYSMLADFFDKKTLGKALSVYTGAIYLGAGIAMIAGGALVSMVPAMDVPFIGHMEPWQVVFLIVAAPGLVVGLMTATLREPVRRGVGNAIENFPTLGDLGRFMKSRRAVYGLMIFGFSASSMMWNGATSWIATLFIRNYGYTPVEIGLTFGFMLLIFGTVGILCGGWLGSSLRAKGRVDGYLLVGMISAALVLPFGVAAPLAGGGTFALVLFCVFVFFGAMPYGCAAAAFQEITPNRMRAQVSSVYFLGLNLAGIGFGPMVVALFTEKLFGDTMALPQSLALTVAIACPLSLVLLGLARRHYRAAVAEIAA